MAKATASNGTWAYMGPGVRATDGGPGPGRTNKKCYCLLILLYWIVAVTALMNATDETCCSFQKTQKVVYDEHLNSKTVCWTNPLITVLVHWLNVQNKQLKQYITSRKTIAHVLTISALKSTARDPSGSQDSQTIWLLARRTPGLPLSQSTETIISQKYEYPLMLTIFHFILFMCNSGVLQSYYLNAYRTKNRLNQ